VPAWRPVRADEMSTAALPDPALFDAVFEPYDVDVPYSTSHVVDCPPGSTLPVTVAVVDPTAVVGPVTALGAAASAVPAVTVSASTAAPAAENHFHPFILSAIACSPSGSALTMLARRGRSASAV
jgi:hypothetical protein